MHTFNESGGSVPAFLAKLWRLVEDPSTNKLICWSKDGLSFIIQNQSKFARELLPLNYKHNNMASFIRQLNMYGFHKIASVDNGGLKFDRDDIEFSHPCFKRGCSYLLEHIKRKIANTKLIEEKTTMKPDTVDKVLTEVKAMRGRQESLDSRFNAIKQENEVLWSEIATLRQKHMKQQQIVNKLIQFLVTMVQQPSRNMSGVKRNFQLMINDSPQNVKLEKATETISGPIIHELTEELLDGVAESDPDLISMSPTMSPVSGPPSNRFDTESPLAQIELFNDASNLQFDQSSQSAEDTLLQSGSINTRVDQDGSTITYHVTEVPDESANDQYYINNDNYKITKTETDNEMSDLQELYMYQIQQQEAEKQNKQEEEQKKSLKLQQIRKAKLLQAQKQINKKLTKTNQQDILQKKNNISKKRPREQKIVANASTSQSKKLKPTSAQNNLDTIDPLTFLNETSYTETLSNSLPDSNINSNPNPESVTISTNSNGQETTENNYQDFLTNDYVGEFFDGAGILDDITLPNANYNEKIDFNKMRSPSSTSVQPSNSTAEFNNLQQYPSNSKSNNENNMTLAKFYNGLDCSENNDDIMRLSTADDVNDHLGGVQDDLENLKSMLRGEGYTLDANTLLNNGTANRIYLSQPLDGDILAKLFGDSDILNPYGYNLQLPNENFNTEENAKTGSELMTYQPAPNVDFFDMLADEPDALESEKNKDSSVQPSSVMNTPHHA